APLSRERPVGKKPSPGEPLGLPAARGRRGAKPAEVEEAGAPVGREQRQLNRRRASNESRQRGDDDDVQTRRRFARVIKRTRTNPAAPRKTKVSLTLPTTVRGFSEAVGMPAQQVLRQMLSLGTMGNINAEIDAEMAELLAVALGVEIDLKREVDQAEQTLVE